MRESTVRRLVEINRRLYDERAREFSVSRRRLHPGIERVLESLGSVGSLLDLGCGDGRVGRAFGGARYVGVDASVALLGAAGEWSTGRTPIVADLSEPGFSARIPTPDGGFGALVCFSVLHHLPGHDRRAAFLVEAASLLRPGGRWAISVWQFLHLERFRERRLDPADLGLDPTDLEAGDHLLDWRAGGRLPRYVHQFEPAELAELCEAAGLGVEDRFRADGATGDLGLYLVGRKRLD